MGGGVRHRNAGATQGKPRRARPAPTPPGGVAPGRPGEFRFVAGAATGERLPRAGGPEVAFAGRSNVGKSSLLNRLAGKTGLARISKTPGRTQQINFFESGDGKRLVDLPGYGFARVSHTMREQWRVLIEHYLTGRRTLRGVVLIVDVRRGVEEDDAALIVFLEAHGIPVRLAVTKIDKVGRGDREPVRRALAAEWAQAVPVFVSAATGEGIDELRRVVREWMEKG